MSGKQPASAIVEAEVERLSDVRTRKGTISAPEYAKSLERIGKAVNGSNIGWLRKKVNRVNPAKEHASKSFTMDEDDFINLARSGTLEAYYDDHVKTVHPNLSYSSFYRWFHKNVEPGLRAKIQPGRHGIESFRLAVLSCLWCCSAFGQAWQADVVMLPLKVVPPGSGWKHPVPVKLVAIIDDATRLIVGWKLICCARGRAVSAQDVVDTLIGAMHMWGVPEQVVMDNGKEFDSALVSRLLKLSASTARLTTRYRGESKGKIERFNRNVSGWFHREYSTWTAGPPSAARYPIQGGSETDGPAFADAKEALKLRIDWYNETKVHSAHGLTPAEARAADPTELPELPLEKVLHLGSVHNHGTKAQWHDPQKYGINHANHHWTCLDPASPGRGGLNGPQCLARELGSPHGLQVREVNGDDTIIGLYNVDDEFVCIADRMDLIPTHVKYAHSQSNQDLLHYAGQLLAAAHEQTASEHREVPDAQEGSAARRKAMTATAKIAELLNTEHRLVGTRWDTVVDIDGAEQRCKVISVDDPSARELSIDLAIRLVVAWTDHEVQAVYRLELPAQVLVFDTSAAAARLIDRDSGDVTAHIPIRFGQTS